MAVIELVDRDVAAKGLDSGPVQTTPDDDEPSAAAA
jgi:large subunit ribosomal protein L17